MKTSILHIIFPALFALLAAHAWACPTVAVTPNPTSGRNCADGSIAVNISQSEPKTWKLALFNVVNQAYVTGAAGGLGDTTAVLSGLAAGTYRLEVVEGESLCNTYTLTVGSPTCNLSLPIVGTIPTGRNCTDASLTVTPTGNCQAGNLLLQKRNTLTGNFESIGFVNIPAGQSHTFGNLSTGDYSLNFTENGQYGCAANRSWFIAAPNCNLSLPVVATNLTGRNCTDASLTVTPTGNCQAGNLLLQKRNTLTGIFESVGFVNIPAGQSHTFGNLGAGEYSLNFTESGQYGCAANRSWFIAAPNCNLSLPVVATNLTGRNCTDASLTVTPTGNCQPGVLLLQKRNTATGTFEHISTATVPAGQSHTFGNLGGGEYNLNFTESGQYGCVANRSWFIATPNCAASAALAATATSSANCTDGTLTCTLAGICKPGSVSFYRKNSLGQYVFVENKPVAVGSPTVLGGLPTGDYAAQFVETGAFLCGATQYATIAAPACSLRLNQTVTHLTKRLCNNGSIKISPSGVCQTWTADLLLGSSIVATKTGTPGQSATFDNLEAADYQIAFTESGLNGCDTLQAVSVTQPDCSSLSQTVTILKQPKLGCQDGKIRVRANGICGNYYNITLVNAAGYLFTGVFDGTNTTFSNLEAGAYTAILTETVGANPCIDSAAVTLTSTCTMTQTITTVAAPGGCPGLLRTKLSGLNCYAQATVTWTNTTTNESGTMAYDDDTYIYEANVPAGTYTVTATYGQCAITGTATVAAGACNLGLTATVNASGECDYNSIAISSNTCDSVLFELLNAQGAVLSTRTLAGGESGSFDDLSVGAYSVRGTRGSCTQTLARSISCPKPTSSYHEIVSSSSVVLYWQNFYCATGYTLQYRKTGTTAWTTVNINTNTSSRTLNNLMAGTDYEWRVRTRCAGNSFSAYSTVWTFSTPANRPATQRDSHTQQPSNRTAAEPQLFPNPAGDFVELRWQNPAAATVEIEVSDLRGQKALQTTAPVVNGKLATRLDISRLAPGAYFVRLNGEGTDAQTLKVVKE